MIKSTGIHIRDNNFMKKNDVNAQSNQVSSSIFIGLVHRARKQPDSGIKIFTASLKDIKKAVAVKKRTDPRIKLPEPYHKHLPLFNMKAADQLPPHRPGINHKIEVKKDENGQEKKAHWGQRYNI